jgi:hypothetical protein
MCDKKGCICNKLQKFGWTRQKVTQADFNGELQIPQFTNAVLVTNIGAVGSALVLVNGYPIHAPLAANANGESWSIGGNQNEIIDMPGLELVFTGANGIVFVQFKFYKIC